MAAHGRQTDDQGVGDFLVVAPVGEQAQDVEFPLREAVEAAFRLGAMALRAGDLAAGEAEARLRLLVNLLEPSLVILFGGLVAFAAAALLQAVYSLRPG